MRRRSRQGRGGGTGTGTGRTYVIARRELAGQEIDNVLAVPRVASVGVLVLLGQGDGPLGLREGRLTVVPLARVNRAGAGCL